MKAKKLIEVSLPTKEISAESVRDKSIRHGHISTLHLWWARRPLPVCRAIVFASLVPDPLDENCPRAFRDAVYHLLHNDANSFTEQMYRPYADIPYTAAEDPMEDNLRNRLMMFIGKFSDKCQENMKVGKSTSPKDQLDPGSLIKWENKNNPTILRKARELIYVAYNADLHPELGYETLHNRFDAAYDAISAAESALYSVVDRHLQSEEVAQLEKELEEAINNFQAQMPSVFDPFAGGGAIPLEAARLGCRSYGNDINPVAHIIERGSAEFPQRFGKPIIYSDAEFKERYGQVGIRMAQEADRSIIHNEVGYHIPNRLSFDVEYFAKKILHETEAEVGYLYPADENGNKPIAYYWARTARCSNPSCGVEVPLLKQFYLSNTTKKKVYLKPIISGKEIRFKVTEGKYNENLIPSFLTRRECSIVCPCCGSVTSGKDVKNMFFEHRTGLRLIAVIQETGGGKSYRTPSQVEYELVNNQVFTDVEKPSELMPQNDSQNLKTPLWGYKSWGDLFSGRQLKTLSVFLEKFNNLKDNFSVMSDEYTKSLLTYLAIWIDRICVINTSFGRWDVARENNQHPYSKQAIPMMFDYPESNPFCTSSGSALNQLEWIVRYLDSESSEPFKCFFANASSGEKDQYQPKELTAVVTDPPYYDAIAYADLSDFFYIWLKRTISDIYPMVFTTPLTPKAEECTAIKHHYDGNIDKAKRHFENKLTEIFDAIERQTSDVVSIMFAHQSTEAWTTLCNSILGARMNITGSWPMDTEMANRSIGINAGALESSVTVSCRPSERTGFGDFKEVKRDIQRKVKKEVESLYGLGFRGADLLTACFGQAVSEFGKYETVEKADGSTVSVAELLELARSSAFDALLQGINADDYTRFYIGWLQMNGMVECDFDDATKFTRVGVNVEINEITSSKLLIVNNNHVHLATAEEHLGESRLPRDVTTEPIINQVHRAILFYREGDKGALLHVIRECAPESSDQFWRVMASLKELLPAGDDLKDVNSILQVQDTLRSECKKEYNPTSPSLFDDL